MVVIEPSLFPPLWVQIGLHVPHLLEIPATRPSLGFLELCGRDYRVSVHGVALSLESNPWSGSIAPSKRARWLGSLLSPRCSEGTGGSNPACSSGQTVREPSVPPSISCRE